MGVLLYRHVYHRGRGRGNNTGPKRRTQVIIFIICKRRSEIVCQELGSTSRLISYRSAPKRCLILLTEFFFTPQSYIFFTTTTYFDSDRFCREIDAMQVSLSIVTTRRGEITGVRPRFPNSKGESVK